MLTSQKKRDTSGTRVRRERASLQQLESHHEEVMAKEEVFKNWASIMWKILLVLATSSALGLYGMLDRLFQDPTYSVATTDLLIAIPLLVTIGGCVCLCYHIGFKGRKLPHIYFEDRRYSVLYPIFLKLRRRSSSVISKQDKVLLHQNLSRLSKFFSREYQTRDRLIKEITDSEKSVGSLLTKTILPITSRGKSQEIRILTPILERIIRYLYSPNLNGLLSIRYEIEDLGLKEEALEKGKWTRFYDHLVQLKNRLLSSETSRFASTFTKKTAVCIIVGSIIWLIGCFAFGWEIINEYAFIGILTAAMGVGGGSAIISLIIVHGE